MVLLQADGDDEAEVGWLGPDTFSLYEAAGDRADTWDLGLRESQGPPCAADFDGDGAVEVGWTANDQLRLYELDGTLKWSVPVSDEVLTTPCSGFDLDGDGMVEMLYSDQVEFLILRGTDGTVLYRDTSHRSGTGYEYPSVADLDGDGHAEILLTGSADGPGVVRALTHAGAGWPPAGRSWGTWAFAVTNANPGGHVPRSPEPSWLAYNTWLARPAGEGTPFANLGVSATMCRDGARISVDVENTGAADAWDVAYALYDGTEELVRDTIDQLEAGSAVRRIVLDVSSASAEITVSTDPDGVVEECDESDNVVTVQ